MRNTVYIMALEPIETRYTGQWLIEFPKAIENYLKKEELKNKYKVVSLVGDTTSISKDTTQGAFLNFIDTNLWKNTQTNKLIKLFQSGKILKGDKIIFPDAWHTGILQIKYIADLMNIEIDIYSLWHAGSYDPFDFLGRKIKDKDWTFNLERSLLSACTKNFFATKYHADLFINTLKPTAKAYTGKGYFDYECYNIHIVGFPFDYLEAHLKPYSNLEKRNIVLFPHRISEEKQVNIFKDLAPSFPDYEFIVCQERKLTKGEYHTLLGQSKMVFSANLQETLGISCYEGLLVNSIPFVPDRLSYKEIYLDKFRYPEYLSQSINYFNTNYNAYYKKNLIKGLRRQLDNYDEVVISEIFQESKIQAKKFFNSDNLLNEIFN